MNDLITIPQLDLKNLNYVENIQIYNKKGSVEFNRDGKDILILQKRMYKKMFTKKINNKLSTLLYDINEYDDDGSLIHNNINELFNIIRIPKHIEWIHGNKKPKLNIKEEFKRFIKEIEEIYKIKEFHNVKYYFMKITYFKINESIISYLIQTKRENTGKSIQKLFSQNKGNCENMNDFCLKKSKYLLNLDLKEYHKNLQNYPKNKILKV